MDQSIKTIKALFNYRNNLKNHEEKPAFGLIEEDPNMPNHKSYLKEIKNARLGNYNLTNSDFELLNHVSKVVNFYDDQEVSEIYYQEIRDLVKSKTNADHVEIISHISRNEAEAESGKRKGAHRLVHNDFTPKFKDTLEPFFEETGFNPKKIVVYNLWRRFDEDGLDAPFALCDSRTVSEKELIPTDLYNYLEGEQNDIQVEIYQSSHNEDHSWFYYPNMTAEELLMFKTYDSEASPFLPTLHSAFDDPSLNGKRVSPRESIEARAICLFD